MSKNKLQRLELRVESLQKKLDLTEKELEKAKEETKDLTELLDGATDAETLKKLGDDIKDWKKKYNESQRQLNLYKEEATITRFSNTEITRYLAKELKKVEMPRINQILESIKLNIEKEGYTIEQYIEAIEISTVGLQNTKKYQELTPKYEKALSTKRKAKEIENEFITIDTTEADKVINEWIMMNKEETKKIKLINK